MIRLNFGKVYKIVGEGNVVMDEPLSLVERLKAGGYVVEREAYLGGNVVNVIRKDDGWPQVDSGYILPGRENKPRTVVVCYKGLTQDEDPDLEWNLESVLDFRDFLDSAGIPYREEPPRAKFVKEVRGRAQNLLRLAERAKGKK